MEPTKKHNPDISPDIKPDFYRDEQNQEAAALAKNIQNHETSAEIGATSNTVGSVSSSDYLKSQEGGRQDYYNQRAPQYNSKSVSLLAVVKKRGPLGALIAFGLGVPTLIAIFLSPALALQQLAEAMTEAFNDQLAAMDVRSTLLLKKKYNSTITSGCGTVSIRCKYQTIREGSGLAKRLNNAGVEIEGDKSLVPGRIKPTSFIFQGNKIAAENLLSEARNNPDLQRALRKGYDPLYAAFSDRNAADIRTRLGIKKSSSVKPSTDTEAMDKDLRESAAGTNDLPADMERLTPVDDEGNPVDEKAATGYKDPDGTRYGIDEGRSLNARISEIEGRVDLADMVGKTTTKATIKGALTSTALGAGAIDSACTVWRIVRVAGFAAKYYQQRQLIRYGYEFVKFAHKQKAGKATAEETIYFTDKISSNPNSEGKTALDSDGYKFAAYGDVFNPTSFNAEVDSIVRTNVTDDDTERILTQNETSKYINGQLVSTSLMAEIAGAVTGGSSTAISTADKTCNFVKSWGGQALVYGLAVAGVAVAFFSGFTSLGAGAAAQASVSVAASVAIGLLQPKLIAMAKGEVIDGTENSNEIGNAISSGMGGYNSQTSQGRGLGAATQETYQVYNNLSSKVAATYAEQDRESRSPLDPTSKNTFLGSIVSTLIPFVAKMNNVGSTFTALSSLVSSNLSTFGTTKTYAESNEQYSQCDDPEYSGLAADPFCNLRYAIPVDDLKIDPDEVLSYMLTNNYITEDSEAPLGDYAEYVAKCFNRQTSIGDDQTDYTDGESEGNGDAGDECVIGRGGSDEYRNKMFRLFYIDTTISDGLDEDFDDVSTASSTGNIGGGTEFRIASFNLRGASHDGDAGTPSWQGRIENSLAVIKEKEFDVIAFQEFEPVQRDYLRSHLSNYGISNHGKTSDSIMWNNDKFKKVDQGTWQTQYFNNNSSNPLNIDEPWVKLEDRSTEQHFYVMSVHDPINRPGTNATTRYNNTLKHTETVKELQQDAPVLTVGDFNAGFIASDGSGSLSNEKTPYCTMTRNGLMNHVYDLAEKRDNKCPDPVDPNTKHLNIDHIFMTPEIEVDQSKIPYGIIDSNYNVNGSDHATLYSDIVIPSSSNSYKNPVYNGNAPDPSIIKGEDGTYHIYSTGGTASNPFIHLTSKDLINWTKKDEIFTSVPSLITGDVRWAPDIAKTGSFYTLTFTGGTGSSKSIGYATSKSAGGPFTYKGTLITDASKTIDSHIFVDNGKTYLFYGSGYIKVSELNVSSDGKLSIKDGTTKQLVDKIPSEFTVEGAWVQKVGEWYYLYYSSGTFEDKSGANEYKVRVVRSRNVTGPYQQPDDSNIIMQGKGAFRGPGHNAVIVDEAGKSWIVYHAWKGENRVLMIDRIDYINDWPKINNGFPSSITKQGPVTTGLEL
ncbi:MAG: family 43 glycosylhydrolase [Candidatus Saccharimonadales bacterium]